MYCTGGIRCDVYSTFLRKQGFSQLYTLEGGIQSYLRHEGSQHWKGSLFVFDGRMAIPAAGAGERLCHRGCWGWRIEPHRQADAHSPQQAAPCTDLSGAAAHKVASGREPCRAVVQGL